MSWRSRRRVAPAAAETPLIALDAVVLDTETTGLDVRADRVVQIGALRLHGDELLEAEQFEAVLDPGIPIPEVAARVHGLSDGDVAGKPGFAARAPELRDFIGNAVVIGHSIHFDLAVLRHEAARHGIDWPEPQALDVAFLAAGLDRGLVDTSLDSLALGLGITIEGRHTATGDARATAQVYAALMRRLLATGVRTLGEAQTLSQRAGDLVARQRNAGWFERPDGRPDYGRAAMLAGGQQAVDSFLYHQRLADVMTSPVISVPARASLLEAAAVMHENRIGSLFVEIGGASGIITERDVLRSLAEKGAEAGALRAGEVMTAPVISAPADTFLYRALGLMARRGLRYLGVTDTGGRLTGIFTLRSLLRERALATLSVGDEIVAATGARDLARVQAALPKLAMGLLADGLDARAVCAVIAAEARAMTARAAELAEAEMMADERGPAPADYALLVLGSGGRGESMLAPDQDNALVIADDYAGDLDAEDDWFSRFAHRLTAILDEAGIPLCKGGVMARNRQWRQRLSEWQAQLADWVQTHDPQAILNVDIFYDFTAAHVSSAAGAQLAEVLRTAATGAVQSAPGLLRAMTEIAGAHSPPLGMFGRIRKDDEGRVDLKAGALLPITAGARVIALRHGVQALTTPARLVEAARRAGIGETDAEILADIHGFLLRIILSQQIADIAAGIRPSNRVRVASLGHQDRAHLQDALGRIGLIEDLLRDVLRGG